MEHTRKPQDIPSQRTPCARKADFWTLDKLRFLEKYLPAFIKATQRAKHRYYIDGFAGPGKNLVGQKTYLGSPLIALEACQTPPGFDKLFLVEKSKENFRCLQEEVNKYPAEVREKTILINDDFNEVVDNILREIPIRAPTMFLLDPHGLELSWDTIEKIAQREKADIFILISASGVNRNIKNASAHNTITRFFGNEGWKNLTSSKPSFYSFAELYRKRLEELGLEGTELFIVARNRKNSPMHILALHSKHKIALKIANDVIERLEEEKRGRNLFRY
ncbi:three-Cys-motif partner protein TcmP [Thermus caldilimi]|uniref:three-Cys-motif partner protein TcmP n=1 Tax=Thermus caldilimi TaxID=2483360 RepID=UPI00142DFCFB|nr:three-Cys-motif partner protein TcmP [Thermus caldilimi]